MASNTEEPTLPVTPLTTFRLFPRLPLELRRCIWKFAAFEARLLELLPHADAFGRPYYLFTSSPTPVTLHVCRESRSEALAIFSKAFSIVCKFTETKQRYIWTNFSVDTIKIEQYYLRDVERGERASIRRLRVKADHPETFKDVCYPYDYEMNARA
ncbi:hypothetical protein GLAREA_09058 [Glarea lozoyensis ATCC 20868]|uniref:2EXR domain-containing protein n=1 Tax=Glarea lozoyensis (strain ATCC 20868 / MF5171) TaxID=1116229 RepID=S3DGS7_GLAL2|nr:uncharacterized protein GLAREA_09058 [Glarea lozoyensis ATCC 20868]EPE36895.1 hypothetical protein GLAREA_09058 [Glarea lozoyensis ATCC 20868]